MSDTMRMQVVLRDGDRACGPFSLYAPRTPDLPTMVTYLKGLQWPAPTDEAFSVVELWLEGRLVGVVPAEGWNIARTRPTSILVIDNGCDYSDHEILFVDISGWEDLADELRAIVPLSNRSGGIDTGWSQETRSCLGIVTPEWWAGHTIPVVNWLAHNSYRNGPPDVGWEAHFEEQCTERRQRDTDITDGQLVAMDAILARLRR